MPTSPSGSNSVVYNSSTNEYCFKFNSDTLYWYHNGNDTVNWWGSGGVLISIRARTYDGHTDVGPSWTGGPIIKNENEEDIYPFQATFSRISYDKVGDTVVTKWKMRYNGNLWFQYQYKLHISGRTLVLRVEALDGLNGIDMASGFLLDKVFAYADNPRAIKIPYLTLFNLAYCRNSFLSVFFDWEKTNCSQYTPEPWPENGDPPCLRFAPRVAYLKKTNLHRNPLNETIYITVSPDLNGALPNLVGPQSAPYREESMNRTVLAYGPPFPWLLYPDPIKNGFAYRLLDSIKQRGVENIAVIIKNYQYYGFDHGLPVVLDPAGNPNPFTYRQCDKIDYGGQGSRSSLDSLRHRADSLNYSFAFHEDYLVNTVTTPPDLSHLAMDPNNNPIVIGPLPNCYNDYFHITKPSIARNDAGEWAGKLSYYYHPSWSYLDVHSAVNPSWYVDYDTSTEGAGLFRYVLQQYRKLPDTLRYYYHGPVEGEGWNHFLYIGYFDDFEAGIHTTSESVNETLAGYKAPLLVDFDLMKMHGRSALHGAGHWYAFVPDQSGMNRDTLLMFIATELAYGHGGLLTKCYVFDYTIEHAVLEYNHVLPMQQAYMNANPVSILYAYGNTPPSLTASQYIKLHPNYWNINHSDFMGRVKVTYDNGVVVCVNRSSSNWNVSGIGISGRWFTQNTVGVNTPIAGPSNTTTFNLKAGNGWVCYNPFKTPPSAPILCSPPNGHINMGVYPTFMWYKASGALSYQIQISIHSNFIPIFSSDSGFTDTIYNYDDRPLAPYTKYYWHVRGINGIGAGPWSTPWSFTTGGGCPYVFEWNGNSFECDNNILPQSEYDTVSVQDVADYYRLNKTPEISDGYYNLEIKEFENELSYFDSFKLLGIAHSKNYKIAVLPDGRFVQYSISYKMKNSEYPGPALEKLSTFDQSIMSVNAGDSLILHFENVAVKLDSTGSEKKGGIVIAGCTNQSIVDNPLSKVQLLQVLKAKIVGWVSADSANSDESASFTLREKPSMVYIPLANLQNDIKIKFSSPATLDYVTLAVEVPLTQGIEELQLASAVHSVKGDIRLLVEKADSLYATLNPSESIQLCYKSLSCKEGEVVDLVLFTQGRYIHLDVNTSGESEIPKTFNLYANYPNPFNPSTSIAYDLPQDCNVTLKIFNMLGQEVTTLVNTRQTAGHYVTTFDAKRLASGIYLFRLNAGSYVSTKKMSLLK
jgi:hypothetical protein